MRLFEEVESSGDGYIRPLEPHFEYIQRSGRPEIIRVRNLLESWFADYPENGQNSKLNMRKRLRGNKQRPYIPRERIFHEAFFELFIYTVLLRLGCEITIDPRIPETDLKPDFKATHTTSQQTFYVEATVKKKDYPLKYETLFNRITWALRQIESHDFSISIHHFRLDPDIEPVLIDGDLISYARNQLCKAPQSNYFESSDLFSFTGGELSLSFCPLPDRYKGVSLVTLPSTICYAESTIRSGILRKGKKYPQLDKPYIVAVNAMETPFGPQDGFNAVYGPNGALRKNRLSHTSAFWSACLLSPSMLGSARIYQFENCFALRKFAPDFPCLPEYHFEADDHGKPRLTFEEGLTVQQILGLASHWPENKPRPKSDIWG